MIYCLLLKFGPITILKTLFLIQKLKTFESKHQPFLLLEWQKSLRYEHLIIIKMILMGIIKLKLPIFWSCFYKY